MEKFFDEQEDQSEVKAEIVRKYFWAWAKAIIPTVTKFKGDRIAYIDLFAGPGRYKDGASSTPLLILEQAIKDPKMAEMLTTFFNDGDASHALSLKNAIEALPGIKSIKHQPTVSNAEVGVDIVKKLEEIRLVPTLLFVDPWGYKGLSLRLINAVLKDWACECLFFFNYNRINMGLTNKLVKDHMDALFGEPRANELRASLADLSPSDREFAIVEAISASLIEMGGKYVLPFGFRHPRRGRTSHHLIFVSKHPLGYRIMKDIMASESSTKNQGVASFEYSPASQRNPLLFELNRPLDELGGILLDKFAGRTMSMGAVFDEHNVGTPFVSKNYKDVLNELEVSGQISAFPPLSKRPKRAGKPTFSDKVVVVFPARKPGT